MIKYQYTITYEASIDEATGEVVETKIVGKKEKSPKEKRDVDPNPVLILEDNKFILSPAAVAILGVEVGEKLDINYDGNIPVIAKSETLGTNGTKLSKSLTCSFRGNKNVELRKRGTEFKLVKHPSSAGIFILDSGNPPEELTGDENIQMPEDNDFDFESLIDVSDEQITEVKSSFFTFK